MPGEVSLQLKSAHDWRGGGGWGVFSQKVLMPGEVMVLKCHHTIPAYMLSICSPVVKRRNWRLSPAYIVMLEDILGNYPPPLLVASGGQSFNFFCQTHSNVLYLGPLVPLFWISGDVSSGFQSLIGIAEGNVMYIS